MIPKFILKKMTRKFGARMRANPKKDIRWLPPRGAFPVISGFGGVVRSNTDDPLEDSDLDEEEFQFWIRVNNICSKCRVCERIVSGGRVMRKEHLKATTDEDKTPCSIKLRAAMKVSQARRNCIVCDKFAYTQKWGFWFCGEPCINRWKALFKSESANFIMRLIEARNSGWQK